MNDLFRGHGVEISLEHPDDFLLVKETLTRIGIASKKNKTLYPSCILLHKQGHYAILHFLEMFRLDGRDSNIEKEDLQRRNLIVHLLQEWDLCKVLDQNTITDRSPINAVKVLAHKEKAEWQIVPKYSVGVKKR